MLLMFLRIFVLRHAQSKSHRLITTFQKEQDKKDANPTHFCAKRLSSVTLLRNLFIASLEH